MSDAKRKTDSKGQKSAASPRPPSIEQVARNALNSILATSIRRRKEYGGMIYRNAGTFAAMEPVTQDEPAKVNVGQDLPNCGCPENTDPVAYYHTHPTYSVAGFKGSYNEFSDEDKQVATDHKIDAFVGTLDGSFLRYDWKLEKVIRLRGGLKNTGD